MKWNPPDPLELAIMLTCAFVIYAAILIFAGLIQ